jgi:putative membrane protein
MIGAALVALVAVLHLWILVLEMFLWESPRARRAFGTSAEFAANTRALAANQGLYNGFLAAGLIWALLAGVNSAGQPQALFFLACVAIAGVYGAATASRKILFVQTVPASLAMAAVLAGV